MIISSLSFTDVATGTIGFSQSNYTVIEGEAVIVCIILISQTGALTGIALIGFNAPQGVLGGFRAMDEVNFAGVMVGDPLLCQNLTIQEDSAVEQDQKVMLSAFIEGLETVSFSPGGDNATVIVIDDDGMFILSY